MLVSKLRTTSLLHGLYHGKSQVIPVTAFCIQAKDSDPSFKFPNITSTHLSPQLGSESLAWIQKAVTGITCDFPCRSCSILHWVHIVREGLLCQYIIDKYHRGSNLVTGHVSIADVNTIFLDFMTWNARSSSPATEMTKLRTCGHLSNGIHERQMMALCPYG